MKPRRRILWSWGALTDMVRGPSGTYTLLWLQITTLRLRLERSPCVVEDATLSATNECWCTWRSSESSSPRASRRPMTLPRSSRRSFPSGSCVCSNPHRSLPPSAPFWSEAATTSSSDKRERRRSSPQTHRRWPSHARTSRDADHPWRNIYQAPP